MNIEKQKELIDTARTYVKDLCEARYPSAPDSAKLAAVNLLHAELLRSLDTSSFHNESRVDKSDLLSHSGALSVLEPWHERKKDAKGQYDLDNATMSYDVSETMSDEEQEGYF